MAAFAKAAPIPKCPLVSQESSQAVDLLRGSVGGFTFGRFAVQGGEEFLGGSRWRHRSLENDVLGSHIL